MDATRALIVLLGAGLAGCAAAGPESRLYVHEASESDDRLREALDAVPEDKVPPGPLEVALKIPLVVPHTAILFAKDAPRALAEFALLPFTIVGGLLEAIGLIKPERDVPPPSRERPR